MRFKSNDPPVGYGGLYYKPRYNQRFITGGMMPSRTETEKQAPKIRTVRLPRGVTFVDPDEENINIHDLNADLINQAPEAIRDTILQRFTAPITPPAPAPITPPTPAPAQTRGRVQIQPTPAPVKIRGRTQAPAQINNTRVRIKSVTPKIKANPLELVLDDKIEDLKNECDTDDLRTPSMSLLKTHVFVIKRYLGIGITLDYIKTSDDIDKWIDYFKDIGGTKGIQAGIKTGVIPADTIDPKMSKYTAPIPTPFPLYTPIKPTIRSAKVNKLIALSSDPYGSIITPEYRLTVNHSHLHNERSMKDVYYNKPNGEEGDGVTFETNVLKHTHFISQLLNTLGHGNIPINNTWLKNNVYDLGTLLESPTAMWILYDGVITHKDYPYFLEMKKYSNMAVPVKSNPKGKFKEFETAMNQSRTDFNLWFNYKYTMELFNLYMEGKMKKFGDDYKSLDDMIKTEKREIMKEYLSSYSYTGIVVRFTKFQLYGIFDDPDFIKIQPDGINNEAGKTWLKAREVDGRTISLKAEWDNQGRIVDLKPTDTIAHDKIKDKLFSGRKKYDVVVVVGLSDSIVVCNISELIRNGDIDGHIFNSCRLAYSAYGKKTDDHYKIPIEWFKTVQLN